MKAAILHAHGAPEVLRFGDWPEPHVGPGQVLVKVDVASVEGGDLLNRTTLFPDQFPRVIGYQVAGTIEAVGAGVEGLQTGQRVSAFAYSGGYAEKFVTVPEWVFAVPDGLELEQAVVVPATFGTAGEALFEFGRLDAGETVLVHGGAGGVGIAMVQLSKAAGARVFATTRGDERARRLEHLGADHGIACDRVDLADEVARLTGGQGADLVIDLVGGNAAATARLLRSVRRRGRLGLIGTASGEPQSIGFWDLVPNSLTVFGLAAEIGHLRVRRAILSYFDRMAKGELMMPIERRFALAEAAEAHRFIEECRPFGRVLLRP